MQSEYVESRNGGFHLNGSRVPLDCIVREYWKGESPESIRANFPTLSLEQVFGAVAFYLGHRAQVEADIRQGDRLEDEFSSGHQMPTDLKAKLERARQRNLVRSADG